MHSPPVEALRGSRAEILRRAALAGRLFDASRFDTEPSPKALFRGGIVRQATKLMQTITAAVIGLDAAEPSEPALQQLGRGPVSEPIARSRPLPAL